MEGMAKTVDEMDNAGIISMLSLNNVERDVCPDAYRLSQFTRRAYMCTSPIACEKAVMIGSIRYCGERLESEDERHGGI